MTATLALSRAATETQSAPVRLTEWATLEPGTEGQARHLRGLSFDEDPKARALAHALARAGVVTITEVRSGLSIETGSFIGRLRVGPLDLTIEPKISWGRWLTLVAYGLQLRGLVRADHVSFAAAPVALQDLVVLELLAEARDLLARGLHREYVRRRESLATPRGRLDFGRIAKHGGVHEPTLPCRYTQRSDNSPLNQALLAGLRLAAQRASDHGLRVDARRLARDLERTVSGPSNAVTALHDAHRAIDRRTARYAPALRLIELLLDGQSITLDDQADAPSIPLPGFALDMNRLWQRVLARVIGEWSDRVSLHEEFALRGVFQRNPEFPLRRQMPTPRPDFAVFGQGRLVAFLDAKYRDLWATSLPREMLYQLAIYATAQGHGAAAMLYPTDAAEAGEQRLDIQDPVTRQVRASVALRPVHLTTLESLISAPPSVQRADARREFSDALISGRRPRA